MTSLQHEHLQRAESAENRRNRAVPHEVLPRLQRDRRESHGRDSRLRWRNRDHDLDNSRCGLFQLGRSRRHLQVHLLFPHRRLPAAEHLPQAAAPARHLRSVQVPFVLLFPDKRQDRGRRLLLRVQRSAAVDRGARHRPEHPQRLGRGRAGHDEEPQVLLHDEPLRDVRDEGRHDAGLHAQARDQRRADYCGIDHADLDVPVGPALRHLEAQDRLVLPELQAAQPAEHWRDDLGQAAELGLLRAQPSRRRHRSGLLREGWSERHRRRQPPQSLPRDRRRQHVPPHGELQVHGPARPHHPQHAARHARLRWRVFALRDHLLHQQPRRQRDRQRHLHRARRRPGNRLAHLLLRDLLRRLR